MATTHETSSYQVPVRLRTVDLDAPTLVDRIGGLLLDHIASCQTCSSVFAAQQKSISAAGCVEGKRIVSELEIRWESERTIVALRHVTEELLDNYLFGRLSAGELQALDSHAASCSICLNKIDRRRGLIACIKAAFEKRAEGVNSLPHHHGAVSVQCPELARGTAAGGQ